MPHFDWHQDIDQCLDLEQVFETIDVEQNIVINCIELEQFIVEEFECDEIPEDACIVNYCPIAICVWPEVDEGIKAVATIAENGSHTNCIGVIKKPALYKYPAIKVTGNDNSDYFNGASNSVIEMKLQESRKIIYPLIQDDRGHLRHYRPAPILGDFKIISKNGSIGPVPDILTDLASQIDAEVCPPGVKPQYYLGANVSQLLCSEGQTTIQLLKITP